MTCAGAKELSSASDTALSDPTPRVPPVPPPARTVTGCSGSLRNGQAFGTVGTFGATCGNTCGAFGLGDEPSAEFEAGSAGSAGSAETKFSCAVEPVEQLDS